MPTIETVGSVSPRRLEDQSTFLKNHVMVPIALFTEMMKAYVQVTNPVLPQPEFVQGPYQNPEGLPEETDDLEATPYKVIPKGFAARKLGATIQEGNP